MKKYYFHDGTAEQGPFTLEELSLKSIDKNTPIWYEGLDQWSPAAEIDELKSMFPQKPPPFITANKNVENDHHDQPKGYSKFIWGAGIIVALVVIGYLLYTNSENKQAVASLQQSVQQEQIEDAEEKQRIERLTAKNMEYRNNWKKYVVLDRGDYTYNKLGGIYDLDLTVKNHTEYMLVKVEVEVAYIRADGRLHNVEIVLFENLKPNTQMTLYAPDSNRGISVSVRIKSVTAPSFNFCYNMNSSGNGNSKDPWKCE